MGNLIDRYCQYHRLVTHPRPSWLDSEDIEYIKGGLLAVMSAEMIKMGLPRQMVFIAEGVMVSIGAGSYIIRWEKIVTAWLDGEMVELPEALKEFRQ